VECGGSASAITECRVASSLPSLNRQPMNPRSIYDAARFVGGSLQGENVDLPARTCSG
jgi:hypothetical protein